MTCLIINIALLTVLGFGNLLAQEPPRSNLEVFSELFNDIFSQVFSNVHANDSAELAISIEQTPYDVYWLLEPPLVTSARRTGFGHFRKIELITEQDSASFQIEIRPVRLSVAYESDADLQRHQVARVCRADLHIRLVDPRQRILITDNFGSSIRDVIDKKQIERVENVRYPFATASRSKGFFKTWVEPLTVSAVTGTIIYLFYSFRSK